MVDFRKVLIVLVAMVLFTGLASAQINCTAQTVPTNMRTEGHTELAGDIILQCTGTATGTVNFQIFTNSQVTSRIQSSSNNLSEALLLTNEPSGATSATPALVGNTGACGLTAPTTGQTCWQGTVTGNSVSWFGVPIVPPGTSGVSTYRFTNIRVNANAIGGNPGQAIATVSVSATALFSVQGQNGLIVGLIQPGLDVNNTRVQSTTTSTSALSNPNVRQQCVTQTNSNIAVIRYQEGFGTAFKVRAVNTVGGVPPATPPTNQNLLPPATNNNTESGFVLTNLSVAGVAAGFADSGTRLRAVFTNIPAGATLTVPVTPTTASTNTTAQLVSYSGQFGSGFPANQTAAFGGISTTGTVDLTAINGTAEAIWEITGSTLNIDFVQFQVQVSYTAATATNSPTPGIASVGLSFAPVGITNSTTALVGPIPRFQDTSTAKQFLSISPCRTVLLFPFVTNTAGFDTGIAISNTSTDPFGTTPQSGTCSLNFYGSNAPATAFTTATVASGTSFADLASIRSPGFQGYMIAVCNFQFAHGFAFISDVGARNLAMGYLALIVPDPGTAGGGRLAQGGVDSQVGAESLGY